MGTDSGMVDAMERYLGMGEPNSVQDWYADRHGSAYRYNFPWCDALVTKAAHDSGNVAAVLPGGDRAYTPWHANDFAKVGRWHSGTTANVNKARLGDIVFFDWGGSNSRGAIDHVGVVVRALGGGRVETIEGNTGDACKRRVRGSGEIAGYGRPDYSGTGGGTSTDTLTWTEEMVRNLPLLKRGATGEHVQSAQGLLQARSHPEVTIDGKFGPVTEEAVKAVQRWGGVLDDGEIGRNTWPVLLRVH